MSGALFEDNDPTIEVYLDSLGADVCRGKRCKRPITWAQNVKTGRLMCFNGTITAASAIRRGEHGGKATVTFPLIWNHWKDCPDSAQFKRK